MCQNRTKKLQQEALEHEDHHQQAVEQQQPQQQQQQQEPKHEHQEQQEQDELSLVQEEQARVRVEYEAMPVQRQSVKRSRQVQNSPDGDSVPMRQAAVNEEEEEEEEYDASSTSAVHHCNKRQRSTIMQQVARPLPEYLDHQRDPDRERHPCEQPVLEYDNNAIPMESLLPRRNTAPAPTSLLELQRPRRPEDVEENEEEEEEENEEEVEVNEEEEEVNRLVAQEMKPHWERYEEVRKMCLNKLYEKVSPTNGRGLGPDEKEERGAGGIESRALGIELAVGCIES